MLQEFGFAHHNSMEPEESFPVQLFVYDLSNGLARAMSASLIGTQIEGIWHTSIVVVRGAHTCMQHVDSP